MKKKQGQRGIALASVLILIMLISIMASTILRVSYLAYQRKLVEKASENNFYAAEGALDEVQIIVQNVISGVLPVDSFSDPEQFVLDAYDILTTDTNGLSMIDTTKTDPKEKYKKLTDQIFAGLSADTQKALNPDEREGASFYITGVEKNTADYTVKVGVSLTYVNEQGYVSEIETSIIISAPKLASSVDSPFGSYSMICGEGASFKGCGLSAWGGNQSSYLVQEGNIYLGANATGATLEKVSTTITNAMHVEFNGDTVVVNGDIYVEGGSGLYLNASNVEIRGTIYLSGYSHLVIGPNCNQIEIQDIAIKDEGTNTWSSVMKGHTYETGEINYVGSSVTNRYTKTTSLWSFNQYYPFGKEVGVGTNLQSSDFNGLPSGFSASSFKSSILYWDKDSSTYTELLCDGDGVLYQTKGGSTTSVSAVYNGTGVDMSKRIFFYTNKEIEQEKLVNEGTDSDPDWYDQEYANKIDVAAFQEYLKYYTSWQPQKTADEASIKDTTQAKWEFKSTISPQPGSANIPLFQYLENSTDTTPKKLASTQIVIAKQISEIVNSSSYKAQLYVALEPITVVVQANTYCGIYVSSKSVTFTNTNGGYGSGTSFLHLDQSEDDQYANAWLKQVGLLMGYWQSDFSVAKSNTQLVNNIFPHGILSLKDEEDETPASSDTSVDNSSNADLDFITTDDWSKN